MEWNIDHFLFKTIARIWHTLEEGFFTLRRDFVVAKSNLQYDVNTLADYSEGDSIRILLNPLGEQKKQRWTSEQCAWQMIDCIVKK